jgi:hypothetical protein
MVGEKSTHFVAYGGERSVLNLDQFASFDHIDTIGSHADFESGVLRGVDGLQLTMK